MKRRTPEADALTDLILEVFRVNGRLLAAGDRLTRPRGQSAARWQVLGAIRPGPQTVAGVARIMGLARQSVQRTTDLLAGEGLVIYVENPAHRRARLVQLSERGQTFLTELAPQQAEWSNALARDIGLNEADIRRAHAVLRAIRIKLEEAQRRRSGLDAPPPTPRGPVDDGAGNGRKRRGSR